MTNNIYNFSRSSTTSSFKPDDKQIDDQVFIQKVNKLFNKLARKEPTLLNSTQKFTVLLTPSSENQVKFIVETSTERHELTPCYRTHAATLLPPQQRTLLDKIISFIISLFSCGSKKPSQKHKEPRTSVSPVVITPPSVNTNDDDQCTFYDADDTDTIEAITPPPVPAKIETSPPPVDTDNDDKDIFYDAEDDTDVNSTTTSPPAPSKLEPLTDLQAAFSIVFPCTPVHINTDSGRQPMFGTFLMTHVFKAPESCSFDKTTGEFVLTFPQERSILIKDLPSTASKESLKSLSDLKGKKLHIGQVVKGKIITEKAEDDEWPTTRIVFKEEALVIKGTKLRVPFQAPLLELKPYDDNPDYFGMKGKVFGKEGWTWIVAQDFANTLRLNGFN